MILSDSEYDFYATFTTQEEIELLKQQHPNKTIVFLRSGIEDMQKILLNFIVPR